MAQITPALPSRFASLSRVQAWLVIGAILIAVMASAASLAPPPSLPQTARAPHSAPVRRDEDLALYQSISTRVQSGAPYYPATADALRHGGYPLRPFMTFRFPTLARASAMFGPTAMQIALWCLVLATTIIWYRRLDGAFDDRGRRISGALLIASGMTVAMRPDYVMMHEAWAGALLTLSLGLHRPGRWWPSVVAATAAVMIRELALPFLLLMAAFALATRRWPEAAGWAAAIALFGMALFLHAEQVAAVTRAADPASPGWMAVGGWPAFVRAMAGTSALRVFPTVVAAVIVPLSLVGWLAWPSRTGLFGLLLLGGYALVFMVFGRPENFYWGLVVSPLLLFGLVHLPRATADLNAVVKGA